MPEADVFEAPQNATFHGEFLQAISEAFVGNGVLANGEAEVTADSGTAMGVDVSAATTGIAFGGTVYTPSAASFTHSTGPSTTTGGQDDRRVDIIYFDSSAGSYAKAEGTADPNPVPPSVPSDALLLAIVEVDHDATDLSDGDIHNWRARPQGGFISAGGEATFPSGLRVGEEDEDDITETASPTGFTFEAAFGRDIWLEADVTVSNDSGADATEDVTLTLYDGTDSSGTQVATDTQSSGTIADGGSTTLTLLTTDQTLDDGDYFVEVTTSGTDLSVDEVVVKTDALQWSFVERGDGTLDLVNRYTGSKIFSVDPSTDEIAFLNAAIDEPEIADGSITTSKIADDAVTAAKVAADAIGNAQMQDDAVGAAEIAALASGIASVTNPGTFGALFDVPVDSNSTDGTLHSYTFDLDGNSFIEVRGLSDGAGGVDTLEIRLHQTTNVNGNDIEDGGTTLYSSTDGHFPRAVIDDQLATSATKTGAYTTSDEEYVPVDSSGGAFTVTLASADAEDGNEITVQDVAGAAQSNNVTVATEGSETIDGGSSYTLDVNYGSVTFISDGTNWFIINERGSVVDPRNIFEGTETGNIPAGDQGILTVDSLEPGETVEVKKAILTTDTVEAVATGVDLELVTFDNAGSYTSQATLITGDGSTVYDRVTGNPLASYENTGTSAVTIGVLVDNTLTSAVDIVARVEGSSPA